MKKEIICPRCRLDDRENIIAEVFPMGTTSVIAIQRQRSKWGYENATLITGDNFSLICGYCRSVVFFRKEEHENSNFGIVWVHRLSFMSGSIQQGIQRLTDNTGTALLPR